MVKNLPVNSGDARDSGSIPGLGRSPGVGNGNLLQYSCLEHPMDRGAWRATVHRVTKESDMTLVTRQQQKANKMIHFWDFSGGPMVRTPCFHCRVPSLVEDLRSHMLHNIAKKKKKKKNYPFLPVNETCFSIESCSFSCTVLLHVSTFPCCSQPQQRMPFQAEPFTNLKSSLHFLKLYLQITHHKLFKHPER